MTYTRRQVGTMALAGLGLSRMFGSMEIDAAQFGGVRIGAVTYSFRSIPDPVAIVAAMKHLGLTEAELMSNHAEGLAGAPSGRAGGAGRAGSAGGGRGRANMTPEQVAEMQAAQRAAQDELWTWRRATSVATWRAVKKQFNDAGIRVSLLVYNMNVNSTTDEELDYAFQMAEALDVQAISTSTQVSMARRIAPFADKHQMRVGFHGHANITNPDEIATPASFAACLAPSKFHGINLDIGHFTTAGFDPVSFLNENHARITNLHLKDRKTAANGGANTPWGEGDTPIRAVLQLMKKSGWDIPGNIEFEHQGDPMVEIPKCLQYCREAIA